LYTSQNIVRVIKLRRLRWAGHAAFMGEMRNVYKNVGCRTCRETPLGKPRNRWEDNIRMDLREIGWEVWIHIWLRIGTNGRLL
jgi:hypothetical protein